jgi:hypothetical protein
MKRKFVHLVSAALTLGVATAAEGLYNIGSEAQESIPLKWAIGADLTYDDNVTPGYLPEEDSFSINPYVGLSFVNMTPQTTWDVYARVGAIYYFDQPKAATDSTYAQLRAGVNLTHRFDERLRLSSRNFVSYELEPDYAYGFATSRQAGEYLFWQTDNALGYRWSERLATYTGFTLTGLSYADIENQDRFTWTLYNQFRYQLTPQQTVLTLDYRYSDTIADGYASDSNDQYILAGIEHRFSPNTILIARAGLQIRSVDRGDNSNNPFAELTLHSQVNQDFLIKGFLRYSVEPYDTVQTIGSGIYDFSQRQTLRIGIAGEYKISPKLTLFGGVDYIPSTFDDGNLVYPASGPPSTAGGYSTDLINLCMGLSVKFTDYLYGSVSYNYTDSSSDFLNQDYTRNRISIGLRCEF